MTTLASMYAIGATLGYSLVFIAFIKLRFSDPYSPRPFKVPFNLKLKYKGITVDFPLIGVLGGLCLIFIFFEVLMIHKVARVAGIFWVLACVSYYIIYRKKVGHPIFKSLKRNWEKDQIELLTNAEEFDLLEQYKNSLVEKRKLERKKKP